MSDTLAPRNVITIRTRYSGATDTRGSRITVTWEGRRKSVPFSHRASDAHADAIRTVFTLSDADTLVELERTPNGLHRTWSLTLAGLAPALVESLTPSRDALADMATHARITSALDAYRAAVRDTCYWEDRGHRGDGHDTRTAAAESAARRALLAVIREARA